MPHRIIALITGLKNIDWYVLLPSVSLAIFIPSVEMVIRFFIPIVSGIVWVFLKPYVIKYRNTINSKKK